MKSLVAIRKCADYDPRLLGDTIDKVLNDIGGIAAFVKSGDQVLLKPNLLKSAVPSQAAVTHPTVVETVASMVLDCGAKPFIGDSPPLGNLTRVLSKSGYTDFMKRMSIRAAPFTEKRPMEFPEGRLFRRIDLAREAFEFDSVINLPKLKTHTQMVLTLAVKNLFGTVIGMDKASWHLRAGKDYDSFATVLVQIFEKVRPCFSLIDGVLAMEGNGPNSGNPRGVGIIGASTDAVALDAVVTRLVGFPTEAVRTNLIGERLGLGIADKDGINLVGDELDGLPLKDFKAPKSITMAWNLSYWNPARRFMENHIITKPAIDRSACRNCGICLKHCPPEAISEVDGVMVIDRRKCISCFCCHELCENDAVQIVQPLLGRILSVISR